MGPIAQFLSSRLSGTGARMWAQLSLGPTPFPAIAPGSIPDVGSVGAGVMAFVGVVLLLLIVGVAVKLYDRLVVTPARLRRAA